jgi:hypothetical protein
VIDALNPGSLEYSGSANHLADMFVHGCYCIVY